MMDLTGQRFGRLEVICEAERKPYGARMWLCECDCGKRKVVFQQLLLNGHTQSCGCLRVEKLVERSTKHNLSYDRIYNIYNKMKRRCLEKNDSAYSEYGGRGITVCEEWLGEKGFKNFVEWSMNNGYSKELTIDRINNDGNYEPANCRWTSYAEQNRNKRNNIVIEWNGEKKVLKDWCRELGISYANAKWRFSKGWSVEEIFTTPPMHTGKQHQKIC